MLSRTCVVKKSVLHVEICLKVVTLDYELNAFFSIKIHISTLHIIFETVTSTFDADTMCRQTGTDFLFQTL